VHWHQQQTIAQEHLMSLSHRQQHQLRGIETRLVRSAPQLAGRLAVFGRLSADQRMPAWEQISSRGDRIRQAAVRIVAAIALLAAAIGVLIGAVLALITAAFSDHSSPRPASKPERTRSQGTGDSQNPADWVLSPMNTAAGHTCSSRVRRRRLHASAGHPALQA
jgi:hypothetical protein